MNLGIKHLLLVVICIMTTTLWAQDEKPRDWHHLSPDGDIKGISTDEAYDLVKGRKAQEVIVAVLDSGIDLQHEDLQGVLWVNTDEIPDNGKDDDHNGYIDDVNGWSFLGNPNGENVLSETLESTRIYAAGAKFPGDKATYIAATKDFVGGREKAVTSVALADARLAVIEHLEKVYGEATIDEVKEYKATCAADPSHCDKIISYMERGHSLADYKKAMNGFRDFYKTNMDYYYNPEVNGRDIIKDDYNNQEQTHYGCNDAEGPDPTHGTHVAGIIGAARHNNIGMDGIADHVKIMSVRCVPDGDERDKDVASAIRYAVDNGASVINMSFGKAFAWNKRLVDDAIRYAKKHDVLLVHAAGNSAKQLTGHNNFPNQVWAKKRLFEKKRPTNWLEVGAMTYNTNEDFVASFSNFDGDLCDVFAPGYQIYSSIPNDKYAKFNGTSMASPCAAGVAAFLRSYFPDLSAKEVRNIIMASSTKMDLKVKRPSDKVLVPFKTLCKSGGTLNLAAAVKMAMIK